MTNGEADDGATTASGRESEAASRVGGQPPTEIAKACLQLLRQREQTVATAESLTAGLISATFAAVRGASFALRGGVTAYVTDAKAEVLQVPCAVLDEHGAVSAACAEAMAQATRELFGATWGVSATGVAGPDRQEGKPVGTVFVGVAGPARACVSDHQLHGSRQQIRLGAVEAALRLLRATLRAAG